MRLPRAYAGFIILAALLLTSCEPKIQINVQNPVYTQGSNTGSFAGGDRHSSAGLPFTGIAEMIPDISNQVFLVAAGKIASNYWLLEYRDGQWITLTGPRYCSVTAGFFENGQVRSTPDGRFKAGGAYIDTELETEGISLSSRNYADLVKKLNDYKSPALCMISCEQSGWQPVPELPDEFVYLNDVCGGILEELRYATADNFTGKPLDGYFGSRVIVKRKIADALAGVQKKLEKRGLTLLVYDGYRPARAVKCAVDFLKNLNDDKMKKIYYPNITKTQIIKLGFIADPSPHSYGNSVDLTVADAKTGEPLDMGGHFDLFDMTSVYNSAAITKTQLMNRKLLRDAMTAEGFVPLDLEWWHFDYDTGNKTLIYDYIIAQ